MKYRYQVKETSEPFCGYFFPKRFALPIHEKAILKTVDILSMKDPTLRLGGKRGIGGYNKGEIRGVKSKGTIVYERMLV